MAIVTQIQPKGGLSRAGSAPPQETVVKKGLYAELELEARSLPTVFDDAASPSGKTKVVSWNLAHCPAALGELTIVTQQLGLDEDLPGSKPPVKATTRYAIRNVQTSLPITRYCGPSEGANANAHDIMMWRAERDKALFDAYQYKKEDGVKQPLSARSIELAKKYLAGIEEVLRYYPVVTRVTTYVPGSDLTRISNLGTKLAYIDSPPIMASIAPEWLKIQDEVDIDEAGVITRTEGWQGAEHFDANLYGDGGSRWSFGTI